MRGDIGFHTIGQRLAGLTEISASARAAAAAAPTSVADPSTAFADTLSAQLGDLEAGLEQTLAAATTRTAAGSTTVAEGLAFRPPSLGTGLAYTGEAALILPQAPNGVAVADPGAAGVEAVGQAHDHGAHVHDVSSLNRSGPPPELQAYGNGRIPADALAPLGIGDHRLWEPAAHQFTALKAAAERDGVTIGINSSYRSYEGQVEMVERYGLYSQGGRAASPGTSNHGWGLSLDLQLDDNAREWMRTHAAEYGFVEDVPREPWHWTYKGDG